MTQTKRKNKPRSGLGWLKKRIHLARELLIFVIALDFLLHSLADRSIFASKFLHVIENWHIWTAIAVYSLIALAVVQSVWANRAALQLVIRRVSRKSKALLA